ncbi:MAG: GNAT family N-acetyltransferase [Eubacteriales bacterium]|nr:GNAT family N-acetyltransferase [Eubacteriales bacterium]
MKIIQITENKKRFLPLLLLADEQENMIDEYLEPGTMYVLVEHEGKDIMSESAIQAEEARAVCVVTDEGNGVLELKNLAVAPEYQRQGYGRRMIAFLKEQYRGRFQLFQVGTGDSPFTVPFYEACGFRRSHIVKDFFIKYYDHPIYDGGVKLCDMIYLQMEL